MNGTTTLIAFYQSLKPNAFYIIDHDEDGSFVYPIDEGLQGIDWEDTKLHRPVVVLWNEAGNIALVSDLHKADPRCMVVAHQSALFAKPQGIGPQDSDPDAQREEK